MSPARELKRLLLPKPSLTVAVAESLTCGHVQAAIGAVPGASGYFLGGITAYTVAEKVRHLGVDRRHAQAVNGVSQRVAVEMRYLQKLKIAEIPLPTLLYPCPLGSGPLSQSPLQES